MSHSGFTLAEIGCLWKISTPRSCPNPQREAAVVGLPSPSNKSLHEPHMRSSLTATASEQRPRSLEVREAAPVLAG